MSQSVQCPALFISAPASGQGKTTITAALCRYYVARGKRVRVFKTGPDFLDPMILEQASGEPVYQLDLWMGGEDHCRQLLYKAARESDLILIEGVMGLFDGKPSSADLAQLLGIPVLAIIDATAMAQTFGALAHGLAGYREGLMFAGVMANRVASAGHGDMLAESLPPGLKYIGGFPRREGAALPSRHLGLVQADEVSDLELRLQQAVAALEDMNFDFAPEPVSFAAMSGQDLPRLLKGVRIAVARDQAFAFVYKANLEMLADMGAELCFFSPLKDTVLPGADSVYLPGGYPELHLEKLAANKAMHEALRHHQAQDKPLVAECGGMLYLSQSLTDKQGNSRDMVGLLPARARMQERLANLGLHWVDLPEGKVHGHTFHHSTLETDMQPVAMSQGNRKRSRGEAVYRNGRLHASYMHMYFPSNPEACASLFY